MRIEKKLRALADLSEIAEYIAQDNPNAADRFFDTVESAFAFLAKNPQAGRLRRFSAPELFGLRSWRIRGYKNYLIFYRLLPDTVEIFRVLHGARDLEKELD